jgi:hypothetical protein
MKPKKCDKCQEETDLENETLAHPSQQEHPPQFPVEEGLEWDWWGMEGSGGIGSLHRNRSIHLVFVVPLGADGYEMKRRRDGRTDWHWNSKTTRKPKQEKRERREPKKRKREKKRKRIGKRESSVSRRW